MTNPELIDNGNRIMDETDQAIERSKKVDDIERPLVSEDLNFVQNQSNEFAGNSALERTCNPTEQTHGVGYKQQISSTAPQLTQGGNFVLGVIPNPSEDIFIGQTLKRPLVLHSIVEEQKHARYDSKFCSDSDSFREFVPKGNAESNVTLEVISGLSRGLRCSLQSTNASRLPLTIGRVVPSDLLLKDSEISGKHALINWNLNKLKWEVVDMGSLNGIFLNSRAIHHQDSEKRHWGQTIELANGDTITLGTSTKVSVRITSQTECLIPFGVGLALDPMAVRQGGKMLSMEDGMALVAARATRLPIYSSFAEEGNLSDLFAKGEAILTVFNVIGMGAWIQLASTICSSIEGKDIIEVSLESSVIPRVQLAEGLLISVDPLCEIDGVPIGPEYCKVFVLKANKPNAVLETTS